MKSNVITITIIAIIVAIPTILSASKKPVVHPDNYELIKAYEGYYKSTEALLDTLEDHYNWVDACDPQDYYMSKEILNKIK